MKKKLPLNEPPKEKTPEEVLKEILPDEPPKKNAYGLELTDAQQQAIEIAHKLSMSAKQQVGVLAGYAGTGKTTVIKNIAAMIGRPLILAPTGKAALRVMEATGLPAQTMHKFLYFPEEDEKGDVYFHLKPEPTFLDSRPPSNLIIIDEASMMDEEIWEDLLVVAKLMHCNVLCVGDPFQLPPVARKDGKIFSVLDENFPVDYRIMMTEVMRQALDSPIIRASLLLREHQLEMAFNTIPRLDPKQSDETASWLVDNDGITICHTNRLRHQINESVRKLRKYTPELQKGEPLLIMRNCYPINRFNGEVVPFGGWRRITKEPLTIKDSAVTVASRIGLANLGPQESTDRVYLFEEEVHGPRFDKISYRTLVKYLKKAWEELDLHEPDAFPLVKANLGYALTCHKSQGSEWKRVLVHVEGSLNMLDSEEEKFRWLYTAITRARDEVALVY